MEGLYATNESGREPRASGSNTGYNPGRDPRGSGGYAKRNAPGYKVIKFACPAGCDHKTSWGSLATCKNFCEMAVGERRVLVKRKGLCPKYLKPYRESNKKISLIVNYQL